MTFAVTPIYALPLAAIFLILWFRTTKMRAALHLSIGDGGDAQMLLRIRQHGNFVEWAPFVLILMILAEGMQVPAPYLHGAGALLVIGRIAHPFGLKVANASHPLRFVGNGTNLVATLILMICLAVQYLNP